MTLASRVSWFFLAALATVLLGFSVALYLLAHSHLHGEAAKRLDAALDTLAATIETDPDGLEWEGDQHQLALGRTDDLAEARWEVRDGNGLLIDRSKNLGSNDPWASGEVQGTGWLAADRRLVAPDGAKQPGHHAALVLSAALSLEPVHNALRGLAVAVTGLSLGLWVAAALVGRWLCRRALAPVARMASTARDMGAADLAERLPTPGTRDALDDLAHSFNDLLGRLQEAFERQSRFTGDASHQLRTPLAAMAGQIDVALRRERTPEEYRETLTRVRGQVDHLGRVVEALLFLARADADSEPGGLERVDLACWVSDHLRQRGNGARDEDIRFEGSSNGAIIVRVQPGLLGELLDNLLNNAVKFSPPNTPITVRVMHDSGVVALTVEDHGCGILPEDLPHIGRPFFRSSEARRQGKQGMGLGLAIARRIAEAFGGQLNAESEPGKWTRMTVRLTPAS